MFFAHSNSFLLFASLVSSIFLLSCGKDEPSNPGSSGKVRYAMVTQEGTFPSVTSYLSAFPHLDQKNYTNANALEFAKAAILSSYGQHAFVSVFGAPTTLTKYRFDEEGNPVSAGELIVPGGNTFSTVCFVSDTEAYAGISASGTALNIVRFDPSTMKKTGEISLTPILKEGIPTLYVQQMVKRGDKIFMGLFYEKGSEQIEDINAAFVAVIDVPSQRIEKLISDTRTARVIGGGQTTSILAMSDDGDIYVVADGWYSKPAGILRIRNNELDFDPDFFMDMDALTGAGCRTMALYGNNKALTLRMVDGSDPWEQKGPNYQYAKLDLSSKTYEGLVDGLPDKVYGSSASFLKKIDGEWLLNAAEAGSSSVYVFDPASGSVSKKFDVQGKLTGLVELK